MHEHFGKPINYGNATSGELSADEMISKFVEMKNKYKKDLEQLVGDDADAFRYYCKNDCAYIFDIGFLESIVNAIKATGKDGCMVLFQGVRKDEKQNNAFGRPTLVATAYTWDDQDNLIHEKIPKTLISTEQPLNDDNYDGLEHPGDGTSPKDGFGIVEEWTPVVLDRIVEQGKPLFRIKRRIEKDVIVKGFLNQNSISS